jgi:hypothetical protein
MVIGAATGGLSPLGGAALRQVAKRFGREAVADGPQAMKGSACGCNACSLSFSADTKVATPDGPRAIASINAGDKVLAYDPGTKEVSPQTVDQVFVNHDSDRVDVTLDAPSPSTGKGRSARPTLRAGASMLDRSTETIHTTAKHPWLTADRGWVDAGALQVGEPVQLADGSIAQVDDLKIVPGTGEMFEEVHTFAVGQGLYVVHNCGGVYALQDPKTGAIVRTGRTKNLVRRDGERRYAGARLNKIAAISERNPNRAIYEGAADKFLASETIEASETTSQSAGLRLE